MVVSIRTQAPVSTSVKSLTKGFVLTKRTDCKNPRTIEYYESNLRRFLWYCDQQEWPSYGQKIRLGVIDYEPTSHALGSSAVIWLEVTDVKHMVKE